MIGRRLRLRVLLLLVTVLLVSMTLSVSRAEVLCADTKPDGPPIAKPDKGAKFDFGFGESIAEVWVCIQRVPPKR